MMREAAAAGSPAYNEPQDHGFMYGHGFQGRGHLRELVHIQVRELVHIQAA